MLKLVDTDDNFAAIFSGYAVSINADFALVRHNILHQQIQNSGFPYAARTNDRVFFPFLEGMGKMGKQKSPSRTDTS